MKCLLCARHCVLGLNVGFKEKASSPSLATSCYSRVWGLAIAWPVKQAGWRLADRRVKTLYKRDKSYSDDGNNCHGDLAGCDILTS
jgi:hypothetical protein